MAVSPTLLPMRISPAPRLRGFAGLGGCGRFPALDLYVNTGDRRLLAEHFEAAQRWVDAIHASNPDLLWRNNRGMDWGDWLAPATQRRGNWAQPHSSPTRPIWSSRMAQVLGRQDEAERYRAIVPEHPPGICQKLRQLERNYRRRSTGPTSHARRDRHRPLPDEERGAGFRREE